MIRTVLGVVAGLVLVGSSAMHSLLGWPQLGAQLARTNAPPELVRGLAIGWHFAGASMLAFGVLVLWTFSARRRGRAVSRVPALVVALLYLLFGVGALAASGMEPFFLIFVVPGLMVLAAAWERGAGAGAER